MSSAHPRSAVALIVALVGTVACGPATIPIGCQPMAGPADLAQRSSPYDSTLITVGERRAQVCYSRPSVKGRVVFGGMVPFDSLWRTGANEPTILHLPFDADIAGLAVPRGHYSLYTVPGPSQWQVVLNRSTTQWGLTRDETRADGGVNRSAYTAEVAAQELGRAPVPSEVIAPVEQFTIRAEPDGPEGAMLLIEWERTRVRIPMRVKGPGAPE